MILDIALSDVALCACPVAGQEVHLFGVCPALNTNNPLHLPPPPTTAEHWLLPCVLHPPTPPKAASHWALCNISTLAQGKPSQLDLFPLVVQSSVDQTPSDICTVVDPTHPCTHKTLLQCWLQLDQICHAIPFGSGPWMVFALLPMTSVLWAGI